MIGEEASPDRPLQSGVGCFNITANVDKDTLKEGIFSLGLDSDDSCVYVVRSVALIRAPQEGNCAQRIDTFSMITLFISCDCKLNDCASHQLW